MVSSPFPLLSLTVYRMDLLSCVVREPDSASGEAKARLRTRNVVCGHCSLSLAGSAHASG